jgi:hypothetical protein
MAIKLSEYEAYFRLLSENHVELRHSLTNKHFYRMELEEILVGTRGGINSISCILESYDFGYEDAKSDNVQKKRNGSFIIMGKVKDIGNFAEITQMREKCEQIGDDFIKIMYRHKVSKLVPLMRYFDMNSVSAQFADNIALKEYGMRFSFSLQSADGNEVTVNRWANLNSILIVNDDGIVQMDGRFITRVVRKAVNLTLEGGEDPYIYNTASQEKPYDIEITDENGYIIGIPSQLDVQIMLNEGTGFYEIWITGSLPGVVELSYK